MAGPPRLVGINHVALEVGDIGEALDFYGAIFDLTLRGRSGRMAFIDIGDQFIALAASAAPSTGNGHFGLVVDDKAETRRALERVGARILPGRGLDFLDPWGNHVQVVDYADVQFTKADAVMRGMSLELEKSEGALQELRKKGLADGS